MENMQDVGPRGPSLDICDVHKQRRKPGGALVDNTDDPALDFFGCKCPTEDIGSFRLSNGNVLFDSSHAVRSAN